MPGWDAIFTMSVPVLEIFVRGTLTFLALTAMLRLVGQRESGGLGITDVLLVVLVAEAASTGLTGDRLSGSRDPMIAGQGGRHQLRRFSPTRWNSFRSE